MFNRSPSALEKVRDTKTLNSPKSAQQGHVEKENSKLLGKGLQALNKQCQHRTADKGCGVKAWMKVGLVVGTTALVYGVAKALRYFPGWFGSSNHNQHDTGEKEAASYHKREVDISTTVQQNQKRIDRNVDRYDPTPLSLQEQSDISFKELEILDIETPMTDHLGLLQVPVVQNPIADQEIRIGELFHLPLRNVFSDANGGFLRLDARLATGDPLPNWMSLSLSPILLGSYLPYFGGIVVQGTMAFVADGSGLEIIDVSDPSNPIFLGSYYTGDASAVTVRGTAAFVTDNSRSNVGISGLKIIDVSNPRAPTLLATYASNPSGVAVSGTTAFVTDTTFVTGWDSGYSSLKIIDVSNLRNPTLLSSYDIPGEAHGVTVSGTTVFIASGSGLQIIDISNLRNPILLGSHDILDAFGHTAGAYDVTVSGATAFVAGGYGGLQIIDISNLRNPILLGSYDTSDEAYDVTVSGTTAFVADGRGGLQIIDVSNLRTPTLLASYDTSGNTRGVAVSSSTAFIVRGADLQIIDIGNWLLLGTPTFFDQGTLSVKITAVDGFGRIAENVFSLNISGQMSSSSPILNNPIPDQEIRTGELFHLPLRNVFSDANGGFLRLDAGLATGDPLPNWMSLSPFPFLLRTYNHSNFARDVAVSGTTAFMVDDDKGILIIDVSDPSTPALLGSYAALSSAREIKVSGTTVFVADGDSGLQIIDVSNPDTPTLLGSYAALSSARGVAVSGTTAFVIDDRGLRIINVSNPTDPTLLGSYYGAYPKGIAVSGTTAFVANDGLQIIDVSNPSSPTLLGSYDTGASLVSVSSTTAFVTDGNYLGIIDVSNPSAPFLLASYEAPDWILDVTVSGTTAFVARGFSGFQIIDVSNPSSPTLLASYDTPGEALGVAVSGTTAFVAGFHGLWEVIDINAGLQIIDINWVLSGTPPSSDQGPLSIKVVAIDNLGGVAEDVFTLNISNPTPRPNQIPTLNNSIADQEIREGERLSLVLKNVFSDADDDFLKLDAKLATGDSLPNWMSFSSFPSLLGSYKTPGPGNAHGVALSGTTAFVADGDSGLQIINVSNPSVPALLGSYDTPGYAHGVALSGTTAFVADGDSGLQIINVSNPSAPTLLSSYDTVGSDAYDVTVSGTMAFVAIHKTYEHNLQIIDVSDPEYPSLLGSYRGHSVYGVTVRGTTAFVAGYGGSFDVIDVSDLKNPSLLSSYRTPSSCYCYTKPVAVSGTTAFVTNSDKGLYIVDVSDLKNPSLLGFYTGYADDVKVSGTTAFLLAGGGLKIIDVRNPSAPTLLGSYDIRGGAYDVTVSGTTAFVTGGNLQVIDMRGWLLSGTPTSSDQGPLSIKVTAVDGFGGVAEDVFSLNVTPNRVPTLDNPIADQKVHIGKPLDLSLRNVFSDADGDFLSLSAKLENGHPLPNWMSFSFPLLGSVDTTDHIYGVAVSGNTAFVGSGGLQIIDVRDPRNPSFLGFYGDQNGLESTGVTVSNTTAFYSDQGGLLRIIDVSDPSAPALLASYDAGGGYVTVSGSTAFLAGGSGGLRIIDISDPRTPTLLGSYDAGGGHVTVSGSTAFLAGGNRGLRIIDVSDPRTPILLGSYDTDGVTYDVAISGTTAFVTTSDYGLQIINVSDPRTPTLLSSYGWRGGYVTVSGTTVFVIENSHDKSGLHLIDVSDLRNPSSLGSYYSPRSHDVTISGTKISGTKAFLAFGNRLEIIDIGDWSLSGTPNSTDQGHLSVKVIANDGFGGRAEDVFSLTTIYTNPVILGVKIALPILLAFGVMYGAYKKRGVFINCYKKERYMKRGQRIVCEEEFVRRLQTESEMIKKVIATTRDTGRVARLYSCLGATKRKPLPGGDLPAWLEYDADTNILRGTPVQDDRYSEVTIQILGGGGVIKEQFDLTVEDVEMQSLG